ncbi:type II toxin-antitoxin system RelE/ParE family toxin [Mucisphaera calidilacus]|uniref:Plasmid stabilization system protein n=1 Tax=Mucisphaera calidilacus TaxID=2527982 RepID=A0A518BV93_9BACT|nr:type II toxin-antitoxin system RelE/ParE family toxin [Mucisphaera calidilacus]QDU70898.1 Plasmid stabilization system protein [Mucisphaera calidilacus]
MTYRVVYSGPFQRDLECHVDYLLGSSVSIETIEAWYSRLYSRLEGLEVWPRLYPVDERYSEMVGHEVRKINFGDYLMFYCVEESARRVILLAFYHGARQR